MDKESLPEGWDLVFLEKIVTIDYGKGLPAKVRQRGSIPVYGSNGIVGYHNKAITKMPVLIIGRKGSAGAVNFSKVPCWPIDTTFYIDDFPESLSPSWIYLFLSTLNLSIWSQDGPKPGIRRDRLYKIQIPVPPLFEQRRIVARIEQLSSRLEKARELQRQAAEDAERMLYSAISGCFSNGDSWTETKLGSVCTMKTGKTPPTKNKKYFDGAIPFVCPADLGDSVEITEANRAISRLAVGDKKANLLAPNTILLVGIGSTVGKVGITKVPLCTNQQITSLVFDKNVLPDYATWYLISQRDTIRNAAAGGGVAIINQNGMGELVFRYPKTIEEQRQIVGYLKDCKTKVEQLKKAQAETEAELEKFMPALLAKAFRGEL